MQLAILLKRRNLWWSLEKAGLMEIACLLRQDNSLKLLGKIGERRTHSHTGRERDMEQAEHTHTDTQRERETRSENEHKKISKRKRKTKPKKMEVTRTIANDSTQETKRRENDTPCNKKPFDN